MDNKAILDEAPYFLQMNCPAALERIRDDKPITVKDHDDTKSRKHIADIVGVSWP